MRQTCKRAPRKAASGADQWVPAQWARLPSEGYHTLASLLQEIESTLCWPASVLHVLVCLKPKPTGGHRPIALTGGLYRLWSMIRKPTLTAWEENLALEAFWDTAVRGSTPLRAALRGELNNEVAVTLGLQAVEILFDATKFYDHLHPEDICRLALEHGYPGPLLYLGLLVHGSARTILGPEGTSQPLCPGRSIVAGCFQSVAWTRAFLFRTLQFLHEAFAPVRVDSYVDDLSLRIHGSHAKCKSMAVAAGSWLIQTLGASGIPISEKSVILATDTTLGRKVQAALGSRTGVTLRVGRQARDLGVDATLGKARRLTTFTERWQKGMRRLRRVRGLLRTSRLVSRIARTGGLAQASWGHQAKGASPTCLRRTKAALAKASGIWRAGGCTTTGLCLRWGALADPEVDMRLQTLVAWTQSWLDLPEWHPAITAVWTKLAPYLKSPSRWSRVKGHMAATIATLWDIGWEPLGPLLWKDPTPQSWQISPEDPDAVGQVRSIMGAAIAQHVWARRGARHPWADGSQQGVDWAGIRHDLRQWRRRGEVQLAGALEAVAQGALWPADRCTQQGYHCPGKCPGCSSEDAAAGTLLHQLWTCPGLGTRMEPAIMQTQQLIPAACCGPPCFWLRGLTPQARTVHLVTQHLDAFECVADMLLQGIFAGGDRVWLDQHALAATDGGGGRHSADIRLRRCGAGLVVLGSQWCPAPVGAITGAVAGRQTVCRAELTAVVWLAQYTHGTIPVFVDSAYVWRGILRGPRWPRTSNADLWMLFWDAVASREGQVYPIKVQSH